MAHDQYLRCVEAGTLQCFGAPPCHLRHRTRKSGERVTRSMHVRAFRIKMDLDNDWAPRRLTLWERRAFGYMTAAITWPTKRDAALYGTIAALLFTRRWIRADQRRKAHVPSDPF